MSLRVRLAVAFAVVAAVVAGLVGGLSYRAAAERIADEVDRSLVSVSTSLAEGQTAVLAPATPSSVRPPGGPPDDRGAGGRPDEDDGRGYDVQPLTAQVVGPDGAVTRVGGRPVTLPVTATTRALAAAPARTPPDTTEVAMGRTTYRVRTTALGPGRGALQVGVDVDASHRVLSGMALEITLIGAAVLVGAAVAGWLLARWITARLVRLTAVTEEISLHGGVDRPVPVGGADEVGRLAASFEAMLRRLAEARDAQDRLVQDAAHELRTPLTSLRTNAGVLRRADELSPAARARLVEDLAGETRELSHLVDELVELALARRPQEDEEPVDLTALAHRAADRVTRRTGRAVHVAGDGASVRGRPRALERAITNLVENAAKFDAEGAEPVEIAVRGGTTTVRDHGPGIEPADASRVFDRFYRAETARGLPGSGLGLAIVRDVAEGHGGAAFVSTPPGGGAAVGFAVDPARLLPDSDPGHVEATPTTITVEGT